MNGNPSARVRLSTNRHRGLFLALAFGSMLLAGCSKTGDSWARIQDLGVLRVGVDPTFPPFALTDDAGLVGIDVELSQALAEELGLEVQFSYFGYDGLYDALITGQVDVLVSALVIMPERTKDIAYSMPYYDAGLILVVPDNEAGITTMESLNGLRLAVELGAQGHVEALEWQRTLANMTVRPYEGVAEALAATATGEADAALVDSVSGRLYLREHPTTGQALTFVPTPVTSEPYAIAVRIEERMLLAELNAALARLEANGSLKTIIDHHLAR